MNNIIIKLLILGLAVTALSGVANANLVLNGSFESGGYTSPPLVLGGPPGPNSNISHRAILNPDAGKITNWTVHGAPPTPTQWNAVYINDKVIGNDLPAFMPTAYYSCNVGFIGGNSCTNPDGAGFFVNLDGDPDFPAAISQTITGLVMDQLYELTYSWAAVERNDQTGSTTNWLEVTMGDAFSFLHDPITLPSQGFSGWMPESHVFRWTGGVRDVLTFLAHGNPSGLPPSINIDGISLTAVPEPPIWALLFAGLALVVVGKRRRQTVVVDLSGSDG